MLLERREGPRRASYFRNNKWLFVVSPLLCIPTTPAITPTIPARDNMRFLTLPTTLVANEIRLLLLVAVLAMPACGGAMSDDARRTVETEVRQMLQRYFADIKSGGLTAEFKYLDSSDDFFWVPPGYRSAISYDSVRTILTQHAQTFRSVAFRWDTLSVLPLSNDIATYTGIVSGTLIGAADTVEVTMIETGTTIRRPDGWKILCGQSRNLDS